MTVTYDEQARQLLHEVAVQSRNGFGTLSPAVYDTAWVAMVEKEVDGINTVIFPECFDFLKRTQSPEGSWTSNSSDIDVIMNTLAALLALKRQVRQGVQQKDDNVDRCHRAEKALQILLARWDIEKSDRVGFEILIPNLLKLLEPEGIYFDFPCRAKLMSLGDAKLAKLRPVLTGPNATTLVHSLEAFAEDLDFNKLQHHKMPGGSMFGSPSSTAAYLMYSSVWDSEAETYLRSVPSTRLSNNYPHGGFPSAFPTTIFETVWVTSALLDYGFTTQDFIPEHLDKVKELLIMALENQGGIVGFAPGFLADADDTAKSISVLSKLGYNTSIEPMLKRFESHACFLTYHAERNPSISANCNVLICLLQTPQPSVYATQIAKCATYIIDACKTGKVQDKWNISEQYPLMLIAQAFILLINKQECDYLLRLAVSHVIPNHHIVPVLFDILIRTMQLQQENGSWESKHEVTAYSILTLSSLLCLPLPTGARQRVISALESGKLYLTHNRCHWQQGEYLWIEKVTYASPNLSLAYCLAACKVIATDPISFQTRAAQSDDIVSNFERFFSKIPLFRKTPTWVLQLSLAQSFSFLPLLKDIEHAIFPPTRKTDNEKYLQYIPFTWIGCRDIQNVPIRWDFMWEMMRISMLNFQVDAYIENVIGLKYKSNLQNIKIIITELCERYGHLPNDITTKEGRVKDTYTPRGPPGCDVSSNGHSANIDSSIINGGVMNGNTKNSSMDQDPTTSELQEISKVLEAFVAHILHHPQVLKAHHSLRSWLKYELETFLLAHITHIEDCSNLSSDKSALSKLHAPRSTYYNWVRTTGADHTSCPYSFVFYLCLAVKPGESPTGSAHQRFLLEDACHSLATICRQYNDFGSVARDRLEENLNSINFPEFDDGSEGDSGYSSEESEDHRKQDLLAIAEYKRRNLDSILKSLEEILDSDLMSKLNLFVDVTDLYGQIYVARDIGIRKA